MVSRPASPVWATNGHGRLVTTNIHENENGGMPSDGRHPFEAMDIASSSRRGGLRAQAPTLAISTPCRIELGRDVSVLFLYF